MTTVPNSDNIAIDARKNVVVKSPLDYETQPTTITMTVTASDGYCESETYTLTIILVDINEPPTLGPIDQTIESCEGLVDIVPKWNATDVDEHDEVRFIDIQPNAEGRFSIHEVTGIVSTFVDYDVDQNNMPPTVNWT
nr:hypothetical protein BaRGS_012048 [Batillaria attramentaria]